MGSCKRALTESNAIGWLAGAAALAVLVAVTFMTSLSFAMCEYDCRAPWVGELLFALCPALAVCCLAAATQAVREFVVALREP